MALATGEADDEKWNAFFVRHAAPTPVEILVNPAFGYASEQGAIGRERLQERVRKGLMGMFAASPEPDSLIWAHNLGIGRNLILMQELATIAGEKGIRMIVHHHDWWFDNRWMRWREMRRFGFRTMGAAAKAVFPASKQVWHLAINQADARILKRHFGARAGWLPNLTERGKPPEAAAVKAAREWLGRKLDGHNGPVWILPCRMLRRKNVAEALLLARWLRPEAWLVTTGGVSSADETAYAKRLEKGALRHGWKLRIGVLAGDDEGKPGIPELLAASECVMLTSVQEGFGLPYLEAAAAGRPLIAHALPNIAPDLERLGFEFPQYYKEILIHPDLFDWKAEVIRQRRLFREWSGQAPGPVRKLAASPLVVRLAATPRPIPFDRLTQTAQLEVLAKSAIESWDACAPLNPFLGEWRERAKKGALQASAWPESAAEWLSGESYGRRWMEMTGRKSSGAPSADNASAAQKDFISWKLGPENVYPILWAKET